MHSFRLDDDPGDPLAQLPALAERLGVAEYDKADGPSVLLTTKDRKSYCVFKLVSAVLDRMDRVAQ